MKVLDRAKERVAERAAKRDVERTIVKRKKALEKARKDTREGKLVHDIAVSRMEAELTRLETALAELAEEKSPFEEASKRTVDTSSYKPVGVRDHLRRRR